jgi:hypothetical protein
VRRLPGKFSEFAKVGNMRENIQTVGGDIILSPGSPLRLRFDRNNLKLFAMERLPNAAKRNRHIGPLAKSICKGKNVPRASGGTEQRMTGSGIADRGTSA